MLDEKGRKLYIMWMQLLIAKQISPTLSIQAQIGVVIEDQGPFETKSNEFINIWWTNSFRKVKPNFSKRIHKLDLAEKYENVKITS